MGLVCPAVEPGTVWLGPDQPRFPLTGSVGLDEPVFLYVERAMREPAGDVDRRYQVFVINRPDGPVEQRRDMGPAIEWASHDFDILCLNEHTVSEVEDMAERIRADGNEEYEEQRGELMQENTLIEDAIADAEQKYLALNNRTIIGPGGMTQRGNYQKHVVEDRINARNT